MAVIGDSFMIGVSWMLEKSAFDDFLRCTKGQRRSKFAKNN